MTANELVTWRPYCYERLCTKEHKKMIPTHGECCMCQKCGRPYDNCVCRFFEEPCLTCPFVLREAMELKKS